MSASTLSVGVTTIVYDSDAEAAGEDNVCGGPCSVRGGVFSNPVAAKEYVKLFNAVDMVAGTTLPRRIVYLPASTTRVLRVNPGGSAESYSAGLSFSGSDTGGTPAGSNPASSVSVSLEVSA